MKSARLAWLLTVTAVCFSLPATDRTQRDGTSPAPTSEKNRYTSYFSYQRIVADDSSTTGSVKGRDYRSSTDGSIWADESTVNFSKLTDAMSTEPYPATEENTQEKCKRIELIIGLLTGVLCVIGCVGNVISIVVLYRISSRMSSALLLVTLSVYDLFYLILMILLRPLYGILSLMYRPLDIWNWYAYLTVYGWPSVTVTHTGATWVTVLLTVHRFIAVCLPHHAARLCRPSLAKKQLFAVVITATLFSLPLYFDNYVATVPNGRGGIIKVRTYTAMGLSYEYQSIYKTALYSIFVYIIPLGALFVMVVKLIRALQEAKRRRAKMTTSAPAQEDITKIMIAIVLVFLVTQIWNPIRRIIEAVEGRHGDCFSAHAICGILGGILTTLNSSVNFFFYIWFGKRFRSSLTAMCRCRSDNTDSALASSSGANAKSTALSTPVSLELEHSKGIPDLESSVANPSII